MMNNINYGSCPKSINFSNVFISLFHLEIIRFPVNLFIRYQYNPEPSHDIFSHLYTPFCKAIPALKMMAERMIAQIRRLNCLGVIYFDKDTLRLFGKGCLSNGHILCCDNDNRHVFYPDGHHIYQCVHREQEKQKLTGRVGEVLKIGFSHSFPLMQKMLNSTPLVWRCQA